MANAWERYFGWNCCAIFLLALAIRIGLAITFVGWNEPPDRAAGFDQIDYESFAWQMAQNKGYALEDGTPTARRMPGTSLAMLPIYCVAGRNYGAVRFEFCCFSALTCVIVAWVGRDVYSAFVGVLAGYMLALYPNHAYYAMHFFSETPGGLATIFATWLTLRAWKSPMHLRLLGLAGAGWGVAALFRPNLLFVPPVMLVILVLPSFRSPRWSENVGKMFAIWIACAAILFPLVVRNYCVMGVASLSTVSGPTFWGAHNHRTLEHGAGDWIPMSQLVDAEHPLDGTEVQRNRQMWKYGMDFVYQHPGSLPYLTLMKIKLLLSPFLQTGNKVVYWTFAISWILCVVLWVPGMLIAFARDRISAWIVVAPLLAILCTTIVYYGSIRFRDSVACNYMIFAGIGMAQFLEFCKGRKEGSPKDLEEKPVA